MPTVDAEISADGQLDDRECAVDEQNAGESEDQKTATAIEREQRDPAKEETEGRVRLHGHGTRAKPDQCRHVQAPACEHDQPQRSSRECQHLACAYPPRSVYTTCHVATTRILINLSAKVDGRRSFSK